MPERYFASSHWLPGDQVDVHTARAPTFAQALKRRLGSVTFTKNVPRGRGYHCFPFLSYLLFRVLTALSVWGDRAEQGFLFQFSISEEARPAGMRTSYVPL